jgi:hypothetical protein
MAKNALFLGSLAIAAASGLSAQSDLAPIAPATTRAAPAGTPQTHYCLRVDPVTGSNVETIQCWTREEWAEQGVDVDREWAKNGVRAIA